jgi:hypothetical protein
MKQPAPEILERIIMPGAAKNVEAPEWYVYQFEVRKVPFYVGIGHRERASDRLRWVCSQIKRELAGKPGKWDLHTRVIKYFILCPEPVTHRCIRRGLCRADALEVEKRRIIDLRSSGHVIANIQYNRRPLPSPEEVIKFIRKHPKPAGLSCRRQA